MMKFNKLHQWVDFAFLLFLAIWALAIIIAVIDMWLR